MVKYLVIAGCWSCKAFRGIKGIKPAERGSMKSPSILGELFGLSEVDSS